MEMDLTFWPLCVTQLSWSFDLEISKTPKKMPSDRFVLSDASVMRWSDWQELNFKYIWEGLVVRLIVSENVIKETSSRWILYCCP